MTFHENMEKCRVYMYAGNFFLLGGIMILLGINEIFTREKLNSAFLIAHLTLISLGVFLTSIGVLIIYETRN
jgi:hypothetical protein